MAEFVYMNSQHSSIGMTLFYLMYRYHPKLHYKLKDKSIKGRIPSANERIKKLQALRDIIAEHLQRTIDA